MGVTLNIDARPSDALAIAVRAHVPILVARSVMDSAGIIPEEDLQEQAAQHSVARRPAETPERRGRRGAPFDIRGFPWKAGPG